MIYYNTQRHSSYVTHASGTIVVTLHMKQVNTVLLRSYLVMKRVLSWEMKQKNAGAT